MEDLSLSPALASLEQATQSGTWVLHVGEAQRVWWSPGTRRLLEWPADTGFPGLDGVMRFYTPDAQVRLQQALQAARRAGQPFDLEVQLITHLGRPLFVRVTGQAERDEQGAVVRVAGTIQNTDRSRRAEANAQALRERLAEFEERWRMATEGSGLGVWDWDAQSNTVYYSPQWKRLLGYDDAQIGGGPEESISRIHPDDLDQVMADLNAHLDGGTARYQNEHRMMCRDGQYRWMLDRGEVMSRTVDGKPLRVVGSFADISRRKFVEDVAHQVSSRLKAIFNSTYQYVGIVSADGVLMEVNDTALRFADLKADAVIGKPFWACHWFQLDDAIAQRVRAAVGRAAQGELVKYQTEVRGAESLTHIIDFSLKPVFDERGDVTCLVAEGHDITATVFAQRALDANLRLFQAAFDESPIGTAIVGLDGRWIEVNAALCEMLGFSAEALKRMTFQDITHPDDLDIDIAHVQRLLDGEAAHYRMEKRYLCGDARVIQCQLDVSLVRDEHHRPKCFVSKIQDLTEQRRAEQALEEEKELAQVTLSSIADGVIRTDLQGLITFVNDTALRLLRMIETEVMGQPFDAVVRLLPEHSGRWRESPVARVLRDGAAADLSGVSLLALRDHTEVPVESACTPLRDLNGQLIGSVFVCRDVSAMQHLAQQLAYQAAHDPLTGLPNRRAFEAEMDAVRLIGQNGKGEHYMLMLDLDYFKRINDQCGHQLGDRVLRDISARMRARLRQTDVFARLGGDEFGLILRNCPLAQVARIAEGLIRSVSTYVVSFAGQTYPLGVSIGVAVIDATQSATQVFSRADQACYSAKACGRGVAVMDGQPLTAEGPVAEAERRVSAASQG